jgi:hypothetical protein
VVGVEAVGAGTLAEGLVDGKQRASLHPDLFSNAWRSRRPRALRR